MKKNVIWNTAGTLVYCLCQWLITILVVHIDSYGAAGYLSIAMTTSSSFSAISLFSMRNYQVSDVKGEFSANEYVGSRVLTSIIALITCSISAFVGNGIYQVMCVIAFMLVRVAEAFVDVLHGENQKFDRYDYIGKSYILRGIATISSFSIGLYVSHDLPITLFAMAIINLLIAWFYDWTKTSKLEEIHPVIWNNRVFQLLERCAPLVVFTFLLSLENLIPKYVVKADLGANALGVYSSIAAPTLIIQVCASVIYSPFLPGMSVLYTDGDYKSFGKKIHSLYILLVGFSLVVTLGAIVLGRWGLQLLFGKGILASYELFMPIVWVTIMTAMIWIVSSLLIAIRQIIWLLIGIIVDFFICLVFVQPCVDKYGSNGISVVQIIVYAIFVIYSLRL